MIPTAQQTALADLKAAHEALNNAILNAPTISHELMLEAGYKAHHNHPFEKNAETSYQKCFQDDHGKKYFINANVYNLEEIQAGMGKWWDFDLHLETEKGAVHIKTAQWFNDSGVHSGRTIQDVEQYFEWLWQVHGSPYYERYN